MDTTKQDSLAIAEILEQLYFKGLYEGDINLLRKLFNPGTLLFGDVNGQPYAKTLEEYLERVANRVSPKDYGTVFKGKIIAIDVINTIAMAKVNLKMYTFNYYDLLTFHKLNDKWVIVNKALTNVNE
ncbi:nuclear transport factor 2 family protein [Flavobacterium rakeshii]|uniref:nuclear transport factor 2 family protein n=1 Tax=Flavobacterium rakeshii TaxID=1038845 RepID=UPI002E7C331B|nr:nuclear transport factor 2 family protein [Flavobacterium rakeshii]MEE1899707.1 nuclear transport factor 2 family protein [Flavobacterium rakeshii]